MFSGFRYGLRAHPSYRTESRDAMIVCLRTIRWYSGIFVDVVIDFRRPYSARGTYVWHVRSERGDRSVSTRVFACYFFFLSFYPLRLLYYYVSPAIVANDGERKLPSKSQRKSHGTRTRVRVSADLFSTGKHVTNFGTWPNPETVPRNTRRGGGRTINLH